MADFETRVRRVVEEVVDDEIVRFSHNLLASAEIPVPASPTRRVGPQAALTEISNTLDEMKKEIRRIEYAVAPLGNPEEDEEETSQDPATRDPESWWDKVSEWIDKATNSLPEQQRVHEFMDSIKNSMKWGNILKGGGIIATTASKLLETFTTYNKLIDVTEMLKMISANQGADRESIRTSIDYTYALLNSQIALAQRELVTALNSLSQCCSLAQAKLNTIIRGMDERGNALPWIQKLGHAEAARGLHRQ